MFKYSLFSSSLVLLFLFVMNVYLFDLSLRYRASYHGAWALEHAGPVIVGCGLSHSAARGVFVPWPGVDPVPPALTALSLNHWTTREVPALLLIFLSFPGFNGAISSVGDLVIGKQLSTAAPFLGHYFTHSSVMFHYRPVSNICDKKAYFSS